MNRIKNYNEYLNEGIRDKMIPKTSFEIKRNLYNKSLEDILKILYEKKLKISNFFSNDEIKRLLTKDKNPSNILLIASEKGDRNLVSIALDSREVGVNYRGYYNETALMFASRRGDIDIVKMLIKKGADVNIKDKGGKTALMGAAVCGYANIAEIIIKSGGDVNVKDNLGNTALTWARDPETINLLKKYGATV